MNDGYCMDTLAPCRLDPRDTALAMRFVVVVVLLFLFFESNG